MHAVKNWTMDHLRIVMPVVLAVCVLITVLAAVAASRSAQARQEKAEQASSEATTQEEVKPLELNGHPDVARLIIEYYTAMANGDAEAIAKINTNLSDTEKIRIQELGEYIDAYTTVDVYSKPGPEDGSYICYVYTKVKFKDYDKEVPGLQTMYVCTDANGALYINEGEESEEVTDFIKKTSLQDDVVDLNNKVTAEYNDLLAADPDLQSFLDDLSTQVDVRVGEALAAAKGQGVGESAETADTAATDASGEAVSQEAQPAENAGEAASETEQTGGGNEAQYLQANDVVNVRSSDSETADRIGQTEAGATYRLLESKANGWSRIDFDGTEAYVKTEFFTPVSEQPAQTQDGGASEGAGNASGTDAGTGDGGASAGSASADDGSDLVNPSKATAKETVIVRASEGGEQIGTVYQGETLEVQMKMGDGWTRVTYNGQTGYVKSEYFVFSN